MSYQRGSLKQENRKEGVTWLLRYRVNSPDGKRVENTLPIGLVRDFPSKGDAWREVDRLGLGNRINSEEYFSGAIKFAALAEFYLKTDYGEDAGARNPTPASRSQNIMFVTTSLPAGARRLRRISRPSKSSVG